MAHTEPGGDPFDGMPELVAQGADHDPDGLDRKPHSQATHRQQKARIGPSRVYDLCQRWDGHAPPELLAELRALECTAAELTRRCCGSRA